MSAVPTGHHAFSAEQRSRAQAIVDAELDRNPEFAKRWAAECARQHEYQRARRESPDIPANASPVLVSFQLGDRVQAPCEAAIPPGGFADGGQGKGGPPHASESAPGGRHGLEHRRPEVAARSAARPDRPQAATGR